MVANSRVSSRGIKYDKEAYISKAFISAKETVSLVNQTYFFSFYIRRPNIKGKKVSLVHETKKQ